MQSENVVQENRRKYSELVANKVDSNEKIELGEEIQLIKERKFWQILRSQMEAYDKAIKKEAENP